jgi:hypothetical protein
MPITKSTLKKRKQRVRARLAEKYGFDVAAVRAAQSDLSAEDAGDIDMVYCHLTGRN